MPHAKGLSCQKSSLHPISHRKTRTMCDYCADLHPTVRIKTPQKLSKILLRAADRLADGTLVDITLSYAQAEHINTDYVETFARSGYIIDTDPQGNRRLHGWYDFLTHYFQCTHCKAVFEIDAETYHGSGGEWKMLEVAAKRFPAT